MTRTMMAVAAAFSLAAAPAMAAPANPAAGLSVSNSVRAGAPTGSSSSKLAGGGAAIYALAIVAGIAAILIVDGTKDDSPASR